MRPILALLPALALLAACADPAPVAPVPVPPERPAPRAPQPPAPKAEPPAAPQPDASADLRDYYARVQRGLLAQGLLRRDRGGIDTPYDADRLAETFLRLAFFEEYAPNEGVGVARETRSKLHRWAAPVRLEMRFGESVPEAQRVTDANAIRSLVRRLAEATGHPITATSSDGNFTVYVVSESDRRGLGAALRELVPELPEPALASVVDLPRRNYCVVFAVDRGESGRYTRAVAIIRAEHPELLRLSCFHEEIAQGLGLANDSPRARPSIFNDDEEFALLTNMDEQLLRILYDDRLRPGMTMEEARPIVEQIAREIIPSS
ncbi:DUF2927 domain-containing protein [Palleronia sp.]|uniref:DUF2927 domain-containing protein n=1 Tax=Palleronia sp. TaxID=1940284 RepID=UPI0035C7D2D8